jgi:hypothetical protein
LRPSTWSTGREVAWAGLDRLHRHRQRNPFDPQLQQLVELAETSLAGVPRPRPADPAILVCPWFRIGDEIIRTVAMVAQFDGPAETTLDELRVELMYPLDATAERYFHTRAAENHPARHVENGGTGSDLAPTPGRRAPHGGSDQCST